MRKLIPLLIVALILTLVAPAAASADAGQAWIDTARLDRGAVGIQYNVPKDKRVRVVVAKGEEKYTYDLKLANTYEYFPLQLGNGTYTVTLMEQVTGNKYKTVNKTTVKAELKDPNAVFLNTIQNVNWENADDAVALAKKLTKGMKTDLEKAQAIHEYIIGNVEYDYDLAKKVTGVYVPELDDTLETGKAICYGYANLLAGMLRAVGIPAKLVMGTTTYLDGYHAWNEVYLDGEWVIVDATVDYAYTAKNRTIEWAKAAADYTAKQVY